MAGKLGLILNFEGGGVWWSTTF